MTSAKKCKKDTIFDNLSTITQERDMKTRQMTSSFLSPFGLFWSVKYMNFGVKNGDIRILSRLIQKIYTLRKVKKQVLLFLSN